MNKQPYTRTGIEGDREGNTICYGNIFHEGKQKDFYFRDSAPFNDNINIVVFETHHQDYHNTLQQVTLEDLLRKQMTKNE